MCKLGINTTCYVIVNFLKLSFSGEEILPQDCNIEIVPEFPACWSTLKISDMPVSHNPTSQFKEINLSVSFSLSLSLYTHTHTHVNMQITWKNLWDVAGSMGNPLLVLRVWGDL